MGNGIPRIRSNDLTDNILLLFSRKSYFYEKLVSIGRRNCVFKFFISFFITYPKIIILSVRAKISRVRKKFLQFIFINIIPGINSGKDFVKRPKRIQSPLLPPFPLLPPTQRNFSKRDNGSGGGEDRVFSVKLFESGRVKRDA